jgi:transcriptional regulator with XRE-family HTH domain
MQNIDEILDAAQKAIGKDSDRQLAIAIGVTPQTISHYRKRISTPDNFAIVQLAKILGRSPLEILGIIEAEKAKTDERKEYWTDFLSGLLDTTKKLGVIAVLTYGGFTAPKAEAQTPPRTANLMVCECILCKIIDSSYPYLTG